MVCFSAGTKSKTISTFLVRLGVCGLVKTNMAQLGVVSVYNTVYNAMALL